MNYLLAPFSHQSELIKNQPHIKWQNILIIKNIIFCSIYYANILLLLCSFWKISIPNLQKVSGIFKGEGLIKPLLQCLSPGTSLFVFKGVFKYLVVNTFACNLSRWAKGKLEGLFTNQMVSNPIISSLDEHILWS